MADQTTPAPLRCECCDDAMTAVSPLWDDVLVCVACGQAERAAQIAEGFIAPDTEVLTDAG